MTGGTRGRLIDTAGALFSRNGYDRTSVRDITRLAGANLGAVTYHFGSKEALLAEVVSRKIAPLKEEAVAILRSGRAPEEKLRSMLSAFAMHVLHRDPELKVMFVEMLGGGDRLPKVAVDGMKMRNRVFSEIMKDGVGKGVFRQCDTECAAWSFFGMLSAYILFQPMISGSGRGGAYPRKFVKRVVDCVMDIFLDGVRAGVKRRSIRP